MPATEYRSGSGRLFSREILTSWPLAKYRTSSTRAKKFIAKYGAFAVFLARFTAVVRAFVPLVAGILLMPPRRFYAANILSAIAWAPAHVFPGVVLAMAAQIMVRNDNGTHRFRGVPVLVVAGVIVFFLHRWVKARTSDLHD